MYEEFTWPVRVYYEDTDSGGVVYHANYLKFMERARTEWLRALGFEQDRLLREEGTIFVVRALEVDFLRPARFNDRLEVVVRVAERRPASLVLEQRIAHAGGGVTLCTARVKVATLEAAGFRPRPLPAALITELTGEL